MTSTASGSKRWTHFHSALQHAIQRSAHKWTYEDFQECFSLWCEEQPDASSSVFNTVAQHMESLITNGCEDLLKKLDVKTNLDRLHAVVTEAKHRKLEGYAGDDIWREDLKPDAAARAKILPLLEEERERLEAQLAELDERNRKLLAEMQVSVEARDAANEECERLLDLLDEAQAQWDNIPMDEIQSWALQTAESISSSALR